MKSQFPLKLITLGVLTALSTTAVAADAQMGGGADTSSATPSPAADGYTQGEGEYATISKHTKVEKTDTVPTPTKSADKVTGELNRLGNPVRIIWYGRKGDKDGETPQKGAVNHGQIFGKVSATGKDNTDGKDGFNATVQVEGQGNAIDALGWSSFRNKRGVTYALEKIDNNGTAHGEAHLQGGLSNVNGDVSGFVAGNGISIMGTADFGKTSSVSGVTISGGSGATGRASAASSSSASVSQGSSSVSLEDLKNPNDKIDNTLPNPADWTGKDINIALKALTNTGSLKGVLDAKAFDNSGGKSASHTTGNFAPQFASSTGWSSGNGVSVATLTDTPERINISEDRANIATLGTVDNKGSIVGEATIKGGANTSHTATYSRSAGNGIGVYAGTGRNAKAKTESHIGDITNSGQIVGNLTQISGKNSGLHSALQTATAESYASGNGISTMTDTSNYNVKGSKAIIGNITNHGTISGKAQVKSGTQSTGNLNLISYGTGNGISAYLKSSANPYELKIGNITNKGIIKGEVETDAGVATFNGDNSRGSGYYTPKKEEAKLLIWKKGDSISSPVDVTPKEPTDAPKVDVWRPDHTEAQYSANSDVYNSGNGIALARHQNVTSKSQIGKIVNDGVISGQATMYHGYTKNGGYADVKFGNVGAGIAIDSSNSKQLQVDNLGLVSGNHAAMLVSGTISTAFSSFNPDVIAGYQKDGVKNYGLMAGTLIAGNYTSDGYAGGPNKQRYHYFEVDDAITNHGTYVYLKEGVTTTGTGYFASSTRNEDVGTIKEVKVASAVPAKQVIDGKSYTIINGVVNDTKTDSSHTPTDSAITDTIINGVGVEKGALVAKNNLNLSGSIVNGYRTGLYVEDGITVNATSSTVNANPFKVNKASTQAVLGSGQANTLTLSNSIINGDINLQGGDDTLTIKDAMTRLNGKVDMGDGTDTISFGTVSADASDDAPIAFFGNITNAENLQINAPTKLASTSSIKGVNALTVNSTLYYPVDTIDNKQTHALHDSTTGNLTVSGTGKVMVETDKATTEIDFGTARLTQGTAGSPSLVVNNVTQNIVIEDGKIKIKPKEAVATPADTTQDTSNGTASVQPPATSTPDANGGGTPSLATDETVSTAPPSGATEISSTADNAVATSESVGTVSDPSPATDSQVGGTETEPATAGSVNTPATSTATDNQVANVGTQGTAGTNPQTSPTNAGVPSGIDATQGGVSNISTDTGAIPSTTTQGVSAPSSNQASSQSGGTSNVSSPSTANPSTSNTSGQGSSQGMMDVSTGNTAVNNQGSSGQSSIQANSQSGTTGNSPSLSTAASSQVAGTDNNTANTNKGNQNTAPAKTGFKTPYVDAYNSYIGSWKNDDTNFLKNSGEIATKGESAAQKAVNAYLGKVVEQNIYAALPKATMDASRQYGQTLLTDGKRLPVGITDVTAQLQTQSRSYKQVIDKVDSTNALLKTAYGVSDNFTIGAVLGYGNNQIAGKDGSALSGKGLYAGSYVVTNVAKVNVTAGASYYRTDLSGNRSINNGFDRHKFDTKAGTVATTLYAQGKYDMPLAGEMTLSPKVGVIAHRFSFDGVQEQGAAALSVNQATQNVVDTMVGVELSTNKALPMGMLAAKVSADFVNTAGGQPMTAAFQNGNSFALQGVNPTQTVRIGGKVGYQLNDKTQINANIANDISLVGNALQGGVSVNYRF